MDRIVNREALEQVRETSKAQIENSRCRILICAGTGCLAGGSGQIYERMCELVKEHPDVEVHFGPEIAHGDGEIGVKKSGCHGFCEMGPLMRIEPQGILYTKVKPEDCDEIFHRTIEKGDVIRLFSLSRTVSSTGNRKRSHSIKNRPETCLGTADISMQSIFRNTYPQAGTKRWKKRCSR